MENEQIVHSTEPNEQLVRDATLFDDWFFRRFMKDYPEGAELIIRICLGRNDLYVTELCVQEPFDAENSSGKEGILDVWARDDNGEVYNIEVQYDSRGASPKRAFHYLSLMTQYELSKGAKYDSRPSCYVIFITKTDYIGENQPYYWLSGFRPDGKDAGIGAYIIYINGAWKGDDAIGHLVRDMAQTDPNKMHYGVISNRARSIKHRKEEAKMSGSLAYLKEKWTNEGRDEGWNEGRNESRNESIYEYSHSLMTRLNITLDEALRFLGISREAYEASCQAHNASKPT